MSSMVRRLLPLGLLVLCGAPLGVAHAEEGTVRAILLAIRPAEGDVEFAQNLTAALRNELQRLPGWTVDERQPTLNQMLLVANCDEPDAACLGQMAEALEVDRIVYGNVRRTAAGSDYDYAVSLFVFDARQGRITHSIADTVPRIRSDIDDLRERARRYARQFAGIRRTGTLRIQANQPGAQVLVDGEDRGQLDEDGTLTLSEVPVGRHEVLVEKDGYTSFRGSVVVVADEEVAVEVELRKEEPGFFPSVPTLVAGGTALVAWGLAVGSAVKIGAINGDLDRFRGNPDVTDPSTGAWSEANGRSGNMCSWVRAAGRGDIDGFNPRRVNGPGLQGLTDICDSADTWESINLVSFIVAGISTAATVGLLYLDLRNAGSASEDDADATATRPLRLVPSLAASRDGVQLRLQGSF